MTLPDTRAVIRVSFAAEQMGGDLVWNIDDGDQRNLLNRTGRFAGAVHFEPGDRVFVEVMGIGDIDTFVSAEVIQAALITRPHTSINSFSSPAPWSGRGAVAMLTDWDKPSNQDNPAEGLRTSLQTTTKPLAVDVAQGRWELSLVLTVMVTFNAPAGESTELRVFSFDPESEVGTGADTTEKIARQRARMM